MTLLLLGVGLGVIIGRSWADLTREPVEACSQAGPELILNSAMRPLICERAHGHPGPHRDGITTWWLR